MNTRCLFVTAVVLPFWMAGFCLSSLFSFIIAGLVLVVWNSVDDIKHKDNTPEKNYEARRSFNIYMVGAFASALLMISGSLVHASHMMLGIFFGYFGLMLLGLSWWIGRNANRYREDKSADTSAS